MNKIVIIKQKLHKPLENLSHKLLPGLFFLFISIAVPLLGWGQNIPSPSRNDPKPTGLEATEEKRFMVLKERLDRLSRQITKHKASSRSGIPGYIEKEDLDLPAFPEITKEDSIEDSLLMLKKRLENLHHILEQES